MVIGYVSNGICLGYARGFLPCFGKEMASRVGYTQWIAFYVRIWLSIHFYGRLQ